LANKSKNEEVKSTLVINQVIWGSSGEKLREYEGEVRQRHCAVLRRECMVQP